MTDQLVKPSLRRTAATAIASMGLAAALLAFQQNQSPQPVPRFRTGVEGVVVDVSVLDRDRRPVRGLTVADFSVLEDGVPQAITAFTAIDIPDVAEPSSTWIRDVAPDVRRNDDIADRRVVVIVLDECSGMPAAEVPQAKALARRGIESLGADDLVAVVHTFDRRAGQAFTADRQLLLASIDKFMGGIPMDTMGGRIDSPLEKADFRSLGSASPTLLLRMLACLEEMSEYLSDFPQRRKAIIFVSVGIPLDIADGSPSVANEAGWDKTGVTEQLLIATWNAIAAVQRSNVSIYALDPGGLRTVSAPRNQDFIKGLSTSTGGFAVTDTNDPGPGIAQIIRENSSYYLLGYQPTNRRAAGAFRKIQVRVNRPGVTVRSRNGYYESWPAKGRTRTAAEQSEASLLGAVAAFAPQGDVAMQVTAAPFAIPGRDQTAVAIVVRLAQPAPEGVERAVETVRLQVNAYDPGGTRRGAERLDARVVLKPTPSGQATYELLSRLDLKPGRYELRLAAQSALKHKTGSVFYDIDVPDFSKGSLMLSGLVMSVVPGVAVAPREKLAPLLPVVPTSQREFGTEDEVSAFVRVYQPGRKPLSPVEMSVTLLDAAGAKVIDRRETLAPDRFAADRTAGYSIALPIASLSRGPHLLTVEASQGKASARRQVRFSVR